MGFGFFSKYRTQHTIVTQGQVGSTTRNLGSGFVHFAQLSTSTSAQSEAGGSLEYVTGNTGANPATQSLLNTTSISFDQTKAKMFLGSYSTTSNSVNNNTTIDNPMAFGALNNPTQRSFTYNSSSALSPITRTLQYINHRPDLVLVGSTVDVDGVTTQKIPYYVNAIGMNVGAGTTPTNVTTITGSWPPNMKYVSFTQSNSITTIPKFPKSLQYFYCLTNGIGSLLMPLLSDCASNMIMIQTGQVLGNGIGVGLNGGMAFSANTIIDLTNFTSLQGLSFSTSNITNITYPINKLKYLILDSCTGLVSSKILESINNVITNNQGIQCIVFGSTKTFKREFADGDLPTGLTHLNIYNNRIKGINFTIKTARPNLTAIALGNLSSLVDGTGNNSASNSTAAGSAVNENGGAGGTGGNNSNGSNASSSLTSAGGGGGGGSLSSGAVTRNGGNGAKGLIQITYTSGTTDVVTTSNTTGTFSVPAGITRLFVECWGAGGGGAGRPSSPNGGAAGGGGGAYACDYVTVTPSTVYNYTIGAAGSGGVGQAKGGNGGNTFFNAGAEVKAQGGFGGTTANTVTTLGGQISGCTGAIKFAGGNSSARTSTNGGCGGGSGAGSCGTKNAIKNINISGATHITNIDVSNSLCSNLILPSHLTGCTVLNLGGNNLDTTVNTSLWNQITGMTNLTQLTLSTQGNSSNTPTAQQGQNSTNGFGNNRDFSSLTGLTQLWIQNSGFGGSLKVPAAMTSFASGFNTITGITITGGVWSNATLFNSIGDSNLNFDFTKLTSVQDLYFSQNSTVTKINLSGRTSTNVWGINTTSSRYVLLLKNNSALKSIIFPSSTSSIQLKVATSIGNTFDISNNPLLTGVTNLDKVNYVTLTTTGVRTFNANACALNMTFPIGVNNFLPSVINIQDNGMSQANVNSTIDNMYSGRTKWNTTTVSKSLNIAGTNAAASGTYQAPSGFVLGSNDGTPASQKEKLYVLVNNYAWTITYN